MPHTRRGAARPMIGDVRYPPSGSAQVEYFDGERWVKVSPTITDRVDRIERIMRDYGLHEPDCLRRGVERDQQFTGVALAAQPCTCWLAEPREEGDDDAG